MGEEADVKRNMIMLAAVIATAALLLNGCAFFKLKKDLESLGTVTGLSGEIVNRSPKKLPVTVILFVETDQGRVVRDIKTLTPSDHFYLFLVPVGNYYVVAFEDANQNLIYDPGEYFGFYGAPDRIDLPELKAKHNLNFEVSRKKGFPDGFMADISTLTIDSSVEGVASGKIVDLDDDRFSDEMAVTGFWQPGLFLRQAGLGIYFLEPYDPKKIPVIFVHGAAGSPRKFKALAEGLDRKRFQPWFFHYPSGIPLRRVSGALNYLIVHLHGIHGFKRLFVAAHSMGGLVSRTFILRNINKSGDDYIKLFVTISSPFGGLETAEQGVEKAPAVIPSWRDVVPGSPYIEKMLDQSLRPKVPYYLFFSHKGNCSLFMDNNDGAVTLRSQLEPRVQADAVRIYGYDESHVGILSSPAVIEQFNGILADAAKRR